MGNTKEVAGSMGYTTEADILTSLFRSLEGLWTLERRLKSANTSEPSGQCHGVARFMSRPLSKVPGEIDGDGAVVQEMLYREEGQFQMQAPSVGIQMPYMAFSRNYIWRQTSSATAGLGHVSCSVWFTKPGTDELDYRFHDLVIDGVTMSKQDDGSRQRTFVLKAHGSHLCVEDQYETEYMFTFEEPGDEAALLSPQWHTVHTVDGPKKDQRIETTFTRADERA